MAPSFRRSPGARLIVVRVRGIRRPELLSAEKTRSSDSLTAASGRPTRMRLGTPVSPVLTSTWTGTASMPSNAAEQMVASMRQERGGGLVLARSRLQTPLHFGQVGFDRLQVGIGLARCRQIAMHPARLKVEHRSYVICPK